MTSRTLGILLAPFDRPEGASSPYPPGIRQNRSRLHQSQPGRAAGALSEQSCRVRQNPWSRTNATMVPTNSRSITASSIPPSQRNRLRAPAPRDPTQMAFSWAVRPLLDGFISPGPSRSCGLLVRDGVVRGHGPQHIQTSGAEGSVLGLSVPRARQVMTAGRVSYSSAFLVALTGVAVAHRRLDPSGPSLR